MRNKVFAGLVAILLIAVGIFFLNHKSKPLPPPVEEQIPNGEREVIGKSVQGRDIESFKYGSGPKHLLFVGGIHGGYEWNTVSLAYNIMDYLEKNPSVVPKTLTVTIIPDLNPDGVYKATGKVGRFEIADVSTSSEVLISGRTNSDGVDLNRNFDCKWQPKALWQSKPENSGTKVFSEPESQALRNFVQVDKPIAAVIWHSASGSVYASECKNGILPETLNIMNVYSEASGYTPVKKFDAYPVTGDSEGWLASLGIPALTVEFKTHSDVEFAQNLAGVKALLNYYGTIK